MAAGTMGDGAGRLGDRRVSRCVRCGDVIIGGGAPLSVQSMTNADPHDEAALREQIDRLAAAGCDIVRLTVPDAEAAEVLGRLRRTSPMPIVADIHFDYRLALAALAAGADKIRINPGNIGDADGLRRVVREAKARGVPIRVGVNAGSLEKDLAARVDEARQRAARQAAGARDACRAGDPSGMGGGCSPDDPAGAGDARRAGDLPGGDDRRRAGDARRGGGAFLPGDATFAGNARDVGGTLTAAATGDGTEARDRSEPGASMTADMDWRETLAGALAESALRNLHTVEDMGYEQLVVSVKASDLWVCDRAYRLVAAACNYPLHIGVTEAGTVHRGLVKSAIGIGSLLLDGIGDTLRVSLAGDPVEEVHAARDILRSLDMLPAAFQVIACPTCGRTGIDLPALALRVERALDAMAADRLAGLSAAQRRRIRPLTVAVMGCAVNGPGEARHADLGMAGGKGRGVLFAHGEVVGTAAEADLERALLDLAARALEERIPKP